MPVSCCDLALELLEKIAFHLAHFPAAQAGDVDVVARPVAFVVVPVAVDVQQIELVEQAVALEHFERAVDGDAMNARIDFLRALENGIGGQVLLGLVHDFEQHAPLARQPHAAPLERRAQPARLGVRVQPLAGGNAADALPAAAILVSISESVTASERHCT